VPVVQLLPATRTLYVPFPFAFHVTSVNALDCPRSDGTALTIVVLSAASVKPDTMVPELEPVAVTL
jgi:hypothetical protein